MTSQINNDLHQTSNNNVIIIPFSDNQEESINETTLNINGFNIIELDEEKNDYSNLIPLYEEEQIIGIRQQIQIKSKAKMVENYYENQAENIKYVNCSRCLLNNFEPNELLYFKDRKTLISYLKYCFLYLKKNIFTNHSIYMNNYYDLFKINQSFYNGWKFSLEKTLCKACFLQIINMEYLIFNIKNIVCDYDGAINTNPPSGKKITSFVNNKRRRIISKNKRKRPVSKIENINTDKKENDINGQITPIVIPIQESEIIKKKKRRRSSNTIFKRRRFKNKNKNQSKYNKNISYDSKNNILIINKKILGNYQTDEDSLIINSIIKDNKKSVANKEKDNSKQPKKKEEKLKFISSIKSESDSLSNKKTTIKEKQLDSNIKDVNANKIKNLFNKNNNNNIQKSLDGKNTIIINNINNNKSGEINMNKLSLIQINNNQIENNNFNNYSNKDFYIQNNLKQNNNNILINNLNNNFSNNKIFDIFNYALNINKVIGNLNSLTAHLRYLINFTNIIFQNIKYNKDVIQYRQTLTSIIQDFDNTIKMIKETEALIDYEINFIKNYIFYNQKIFCDKNDLIDKLSYVERNAYYLKCAYKFYIEFCIRLCLILYQELENFVKI